jgi:hypothetical protein
MSKRSPKSTTRTAKQPGKLDIWLHTLEQRWLRIPKLWRIPLVLLFWLGAVAVLLGTPIMVKHFSLPGAALYVHNHTDRPIYSYWVNGNWGGNAAAYGGGTTCCWKIAGEQLEVHWVKSVTRTQAQQGLQKEELTHHLPNPRRKRTDDTLHVHFLPGDEVRLAWSHEYTSPLKEDIRAQLAKETP